MSSDDTPRTDTPRTDSTAHANGAAPAAHAVYTGHDVVDEQANRIGKVVDAIYDDDTDLPPALDPGPAGREPSWLVVDPGPLRAAHYLPVAGSYRTADGTIVTPWDREWVRAATRAGKDHIVTREQRDELLAHYSLDVTSSD